MDNKKDMCDATQGIQYPTQTMRRNAARKNGMDNAAAFAGGKDKKQPNSERRNKVTKSLVRPHRRHPLLPGEARSMHDRLVVRDSWQLKHGPRTALMRPLPPRRPAIGAPRHAA
jgi:hypothetical protein